MKFVFASLISGRNVNFANADEEIPTVGDHGRSTGKLPHGGRFLKTHEPYWREYGRSIYLLRDPRDVAISYRRYLEGFQVKFDSMDEFLDQFQRGRVGGYGSWLDHVNGWFNAKSQGTPILPLFYEELVADPQRHVTEAASFVGIEVTDSTVADAIEGNSVDRMRKKESDSASYFANSGWSNSSVSFIGKADSGGWKEQLSASSLERLKPACERYAELLAEN